MNAPSQQEAALGLHVFASGGLRFPLSNARDPCEPPSESGHLSLSLSLSLCVCVCVCVCVCFCDVSCLVLPLLFVCLLSFFCLSSLHIFLLNLCRSSLSPPRHPLIIAHLSLSLSLYLSISLSLSTSDFFQERMPCQGRGRGRDEEELA